LGRTPAIVTVRLLVPERGILSVAVSETVLEILLVRQLAHALEKLWDFQKESQPVTG
jgi:hypothetical protein